MKRTVSVLLMIAIMLGSIFAVMSINATEDVAPEKPEGTFINNNVDYANNLVDNAETAGKVYYLNFDVYDAPLSGFKGTLDGNGHTFTVSAAAFDDIAGATIKNLKIVVKGGNTVFGALKNVTLENVTIDTVSGNVASSVEACNFKNVDIKIATAGSSVFGNTILNSEFSGVNATVAGEKSITASSSFGGLATTIENSTLKDVVCEYAIKVSGFKAYVGTIGGIASQAKGTVVLENVKHIGDINVKTWATFAEHSAIKESVHVGGLIGMTAEQSDVTFKGCENVGNIYSTQSAVNVGGILAYLSASDVTMNNCKNSGNLMSMSDDPANIHLGIGGMIGWTNNRGIAQHFINISDCENHGSIIETPRELIFGAFCEISALEENAANKGDADYEPITAEGFAEKYLEEFMWEYFSKEENRGKEDEEAIEACMSQNIFNSSNALYVGGIVGRAFAIPSIRINSCKNFGDISAPGSTNTWGGAGGIVGGFVTVGNWDGLSASDMYIVNCYNEGTIHAHEPGGIIGGRFMQYTSVRSKLVVEYCINAGEIIGKEAGRAGGIVCDFDGMNGDNACNMTDITIKNCANYGDVSGATVSGGIVSSICNEVSDPKIPTIANCYNAGNISTINDMTTVNKGTEEEAEEIKEADMAGGIIGSTAIPSVIKNCINVGAITTETEGAAAPIIGGALSTVWTENNVHLGEGEFEHSTSKTEAEIEALVADMDFAKANNNAALESLIAEVEIVIEIDYSADSWKAFSDALAAAKRVNASGLASQSDLDAITAKLKAAHEGLEQIPADLSVIEQKIREGRTYKKDDWGDYSFMVLTEAIQTAIEVRNTENVLQSKVNAAVDAITYAIINLEEVGEKYTLEIVTDIVIGELHTKPVTNTEAPTGEVETGGNDATEPADQGGCGSIIGGAAVVLVAVAAIGVGVSLKKKED